MSGDDREQQLRRLLEIVDAEREAGAADAADLELPDVDLATLLGAMVALEATVRAETKASREVRDRLESAVQTLRDELKGHGAREARQRDESERRLAMVGERAALDLIDIADRLAPAVERARELARPRWRWFRMVADPVAVSLAEGLQLTWRRLERRLSDRGVRRVETVGEPFDPHTMEALERTVSFDADHDVVVVEVTAGYVRRAAHDEEQVLRAAQVVVNQHPGSDEP